MFKKQKNPKRFWTKHNLKLLKSRRELCETIEYTFNRHKSILFHKTSNQR